MSNKGNTITELGGPIDPELDRCILLQNQWAKRKFELQGPQLENAEKKVIIEAQVLEQAMEDHSRLERERKVAQTLDLNNLPAEFLAYQSAEASRYLEESRFRLRFLVPQFDDVVPLFPGNLLLFGAQTGHGKSSTGAQFAASAIQQMHPKHGKPCRVLYISNEESSVEIHARVACYFKGWKYESLDKFTDVQVKFIRTFMDEMSRTKALVVITELPEISDATSTIEGIDLILSKAKNNDNQFDLVILDYYQKVTSSKLNPKLQVNDVQAKLSDLLDKYRKSLPCPILVMSQLHPKKRGDDQSFESRIKGRKAILQSATFAAEIVPDRERFLTDFVIHKNRLVSATVDRTYSVGYDFETGWLVENDLKHQRRVLEFKSRRS